MNDLDEIKEKLRQFALARDWDQFHSPKNLSMALAGEVGELLALFQWLTEEQSKNLTQEQRQGRGGRIGRCFSVFTPVSRQVRC